MKAQIIRIGNSQGIRIPKTMLEDGKISGEVELEIHDEGLLIRSLQKPRANWDVMFKTVADGDDDQSLVDAPTEFEKKGMAVVNRFDVYLINLDSSPSDDAKNTRPGVVLSPDEVNRNLDHVIVAPIASTNAKYPTRVAVEFLNSERFVIIDQIRTVDKKRLVKKIGEISEQSQAPILDRLGELFAR